MQKQPEKVSEQIVDRKLLSYIQGKLAQGAKEFLSTEAAQVLGVPEEEILKSFQRLKAKGILRSVGGETGGAKQQTEPAEWVEG
jgi:DNA-binding IscR family transcriptional regulator